MIIDARTLPDDHVIEADMCIVGAGVAGITLAREFRDTQRKVCLIESGGLEPDKRTQALYWGENVGQPYYPLDTSRARFFGGTSHYWVIPLGDNRKGVRLRPLDAIDFEQRDWVPHSGWPFDKAHLDPYYERAQAVCRIGPCRYAVEDWADPVRTPPLKLDDGVATTAIFQFGPRDPFFTDYRDEIAQADHIAAYLYANAVEVVTTEEGGHVAGLRCACLGGKTFRVAARDYVLATGAIEIPRLLLQSRRQHAAGIGNLHDLVGRFFMEHPHLWSGLLLPSSPELFRAAGLYRIHVRNDVAIMGKLRLTEETLRQERLLNWCASLHPTHRGPSSPGVAALKSLAAGLGNGRFPEHAGTLAAQALRDAGGVLAKARERLGGKDRVVAFRLNHMAEQVPNPESRVLLAGETDELGQPRANLDWRLTAQDMHSMVRSQEILDAQLHRAGLGRLVVEQERGAVPEDIHGGWHHMGTTRMHADPRQGVVDAHSRVHDMDNLYIAGPSVFPTGGCSNPVLTIVALTLRLADHLKTRGAR